jgi:hypothetical protein
MYGAMDGPIDDRSLALKLCVEVKSIAPERDSNNNAVEEELPGVLQHEIVEQWANSEAP